MGGNVALQLGAKYPDLYSGVLDVCGSKDLIDSYNKRSWQTLMMQPYCGTGSFRTNACASTYNSILDAILSLHIIRSSASFRDE